MLRSDWSIITCLLRDLLMLLPILDCFVEIAKFFMADANVAVSSALAVLVTCENENFNGSENAAL